MSKLSECIKYYETRENPYTIYLKILVMAMGLLGIIFWGLNYVFENERNTFMDIFAILIFILAGICLIIMVYNMIFFFMGRIKLLYLYWVCIQDDGYVKTTPEDAIMGLLIPVFNLYWIFKAFYELAEGLSNYIDRYNLDSRQKPDKRQVIIFCWLIIVGVCFCFTLFVPIIVAIVAFILWSSISQDLRNSVIYISENKEFSDKNELDNYIQYVKELNFIKLFF
jgi:ABC-type multidrug transport system fused ATPase/permease subunit